MKIGKVLYSRTMKLFASFLIAIAPVLAYEINCVFFWGEPDVPEVLKKGYKAN